MYILKVFNIIISNSQQHLTKTIQFVITITITMSENEESNSEKNAYFMQTNLYGYFNLCETLPEISPQFVSFSN